MTRRWVIGDKVVINAVACAAGDVVTFALTLPGGGEPIVLETVAVTDGKRPVATVSMRAMVVGVHEVVVTGEGDTARASFEVHPPRRRRARRAVLAIVGVASAATAACATVGRRDHPRR